MEQKFIAQSLNFVILDTQKKTLTPKSPDVYKSWNIERMSSFNPAHSRLWIILKGHGNVKTTTETFDINEGNVYFMPPNSILASSLYDTMEQFYIDFIQPSTEIAIEQLYTFKQTADKNDFDLIYSLAKKLPPIYKHNDNLSAFKVSSIVTAILSFFIDGENSKLNEFKDCLQYISLNYNKTISITTLANLCNYSPEYFSTKFKNAFGVSPQKFIILKRLAQAKLLLLSTNKSIQKIGEEVGYPDQMHFSKIFSAEMHLSPSAYRKNHVT